MTFDAQILRDPNTGFIVDLHLGSTTEDTGLQQALDAMNLLESGVQANIDENRQVGHYWLRNADIAPSQSIKDDIHLSHQAVRELDASGFNTVLLVGIGGSALGPELAIDALRPPQGRRFVLLDTIDPRAIERRLQEIDPKETLVLVVSKSGSTTETLVALRIVEAHFATTGVCFPDHAVAITSPGSPLAEMAKDWRATLHTWEWVGGRTSITSTVGLAPMHLCGIDTEAFLSGAKAMDEWTRQPIAHNPAAWMAAQWHCQKNDALVVLPYADHLRHLGRYLQQLVMESLGKRHDREGAEVSHGLTVYGNKGSADQHAILQQLRDGPDNVLIHFIDCLPEPATSPLLQDAADTQQALLAGVRTALHEVGRPIVSITLPDQGPRALGALIALFERAVGFAAELANINAYHQPGVEAAKIAAREQLHHLQLVETALTNDPTTAKDLAKRLNLSSQHVWRLCTHLAHMNRATRSAGKTPSEDRFQATKNLLK
ncbi:MAG: glucose-6-phosphate isomerase [Myxococcota bacterium]